MILPFFCCSCFFPSLRFPPVTWEWKLVSSHSKGTCYPMVATHRYHYEACQAQKEKNTWFVTDRPSHRRREFSVFEADMPQREIVSISYRTGKWLASRGSNLLFCSDGTVYFPFRRNKNVAWDTVFKACQTLATNAHRTEEHRRKQSLYQEFFACFSFLICHSIQYQLSSSASCENVELKPAPPLYKNVVDSRSRGYFLESKLVREGQVTTCETPLISHLQKGIEVRYILSVYLSSSVSLWT